MRDILANRIDSAYYLTMTPQHGEQSMLVFAVPPGSLVYTSAHPTEATKITDVAQRLQKDLEKNWRQIGVATRREDDIWVIQLAELPRTQQLVMRKKEVVDSAQEAQRVESRREL